MSDAHSTETFRLIPGNTAYRISDFGTIQSRRKRGPGRRLKDTWTTLFPSADKNGYQVIGLTDDSGELHQHFVHRLVLETFVGPCPEGMETRHKNRIRSDNALSNVEWGTPLENAADRDRHGTTARRPGELHHNVKLTEDQVREIFRRIANGERYKDLAKEFNVSYSAICNIASGHRWKHLFH